MYFDIIRHGRDIKKQFERRMPENESNSDLYHKIDEIIEKIQTHRLNTIGSWDKTKVAVNLLEVLAIFRLSSEPITEPVIEEIRNYLDQALHGIDGQIAYLASQNGGRKKKSMRRNSKRAKRRTRVRVRK